MSDPISMPLTNSERVAIVRAIDAVQCRYGTTADALDVVADLLAAARADEREKWASYFETWQSAVGWPSMTASRVIASLRGPRPFGVSSSSTEIDGDA